MKPVTVKRPGVVVIAHSGVPHMLRTLDELDGASKEVAVDRLRQREGESEWAAGVGKSCAVNLPVLKPTSDYAGIHHLRGTCRKESCPFCADAMTRRGT